MPIPATSGKLIVVTATLSLPVVLFYNIYLIVKPYTTIIPLHHQW